MTVYLSFQPDKVQREKTWKHCAGTAYIYAVGDKRVDYLTAVRL